MCTALPCRPQVISLENDRPSVNTGLFEGTAGFSRENLELVFEFSAKCCEFFDPGGDGKSAIVCCQPGNLFPRRVRENEICESRACECRKQE